ncbi:MAG TPA: ABC transporter permease [Candidatus Deferrimicrobium sp.]|nr:ABC transporter permease [Candidatus Deferrimicrobium sp.]
MNFARRAWAVTLVPLISIILALLIGSLLILASSLATEGGKLDLGLPFVAYAALFDGAFGSDRAIINTFVAATPLVFTGLAVGVGFKAGLFNIGGTGQVLVGGFSAALAGAAFAQQPVPVAVAVALIAGALGGAVYGFIPGALKAFTGAHEVVSTIMLNSLASFVIVGLVNDVFKIVGPTFARTADVGHATLPILFGRNGHVGILVALAVIPVVYWILWRTTIGFEIRTVGANPNAARYAGMSPRRLIVLTMSLCGLFAGLGGAIEILSLGYYPAVYGTTIGFGGITVALLGRAHPFGILLGAILLGAMRAGAPSMQIEAKVPVELIDVIQGLILLFLAAEVVIRHLLRVRTAGVAPDELKTVTRTYGEGSV